MTSFLYHGFFTFDQLAAILPDLAKYSNSLNYRWLDMSNKVFLQIVVVPALVHYGVVSTTLIYFFSYVSRRRRPRKKKSHPSLDRIRRPPLPVFVVNN